MNDEVLNNSWSSNQQIRQKNSKNSKVSSSESFFH